MKMCRDDEISSELNERIRKCTKNVCEKNLAANVVLRERVENQIFLNPNNAIKI